MGLMILIHIINGVIALITIMMMTPGGRRHKANYCSENGEELEMLSVFLFFFFFFFFRFFLGKGFSICVSFFGVYFL